jgi:hypothetical protein
MTCSLGFATWWVVVYDRKFNCVKNNQLSFWIVLIVCHNTRATVLQVHCQYSCTLLNILHCLFIVPLFAKEHSTKIFGLLTVMLFVDIQKAPSWKVQCAALSENRLLSLMPTRARLDFTRRLLVVLLDFHLINIPWKLTYSYKFPRFTHCPKHRNYRHVTPIGCVSMNRPAFNAC